MACARARLRPRVRGARRRSAFLRAPRFTSHSRTAISICVVTGIPSCSLTRRIASSSVVSKRRAVVSLLIATSIGMSIHDVKFAERFLQMRVVDPLASRLLRVTQDTALTPTHTAYRTPRTSPAVVLHSPSTRRITELVMAEILLLSRTNPDTGDPLEQRVVASQHRDRRCHRASCRAEVMVTGERNRTTAISPVRRLKSPKRRATPLWPSHENCSVLAGGFTSTITTTPTGSKSDRTDAEIVIE